MVSLETIPASHEHLLEHCTALFESKGMIKVVSVPSDWYGDPFFSLRPKEVEQTISSLGDLIKKHLIDGDQILVIPIRRSLMSVRNNMSAELTENQDPHWATMVTFIKKASISENLNNNNSSKTKRVITLLYVDAFDTQPIPGDVIKKLEKHLDSSIQLQQNKQAQQIVTYDSGWWFLYNAVMMVREGALDYLLEDAKSSSTWQPEWLSGFIDWFKDDEERLAKRAEPVKLSGRWVIGKLRRRFPGLKCIDPTKNSTKFEEKLGKIESQLTSEKIEKQFDPEKEAHLKRCNNNYHGAEKGIVSSYQLMEQMDIYKKQGEERIGKLETDFKGKISLFEKKIFALETFNKNSKSYLEFKLQKTEEKIEMQVRKLGLHFSPNMKKHLLELEYTDFKVKYQNSEKSLCGSQAIKYLVEKYQTINRILKSGQQAFECDKQESPFPKKQ